MYDLSSKFNTFYRNHVVLSNDERSNLVEKKNLNVRRLKDGLIEYNEEKGRDYKLAEEPVVQGSVAMFTVTQNESNDYDIDVAIIFEKDAIPSGPIATKNFLVEALKKKTTQFNVQPEAKANCVRIEYADGYHIDFAIYRRSKKEGEDEYTYEHGGGLEWRERDPRSITKWFNQQNKNHNYRLREIIRLLKMFSKSRPGNWKKMPGGLILSVLAEEKIQEYERIDERFYYSLKEIKNRLLWNKEVKNPTDSSKSLNLVSSDNDKMTNLYNRLSDQLSKLDILFEPDCTHVKAIEAWEGFFNHSYWTEQKESLSEAGALKKAHASYTSSQESLNYRETEEFITHYFGSSLKKYRLEIDCAVTHRGKRIGVLSMILRRRELLLPGYSLEFYISDTDVPDPYKVFWKVKNEGEVAKEQDSIRGQIFEGGKTHSEPTSFKGNHYVECYIVKSGLVEARKRISVPIKV
ncbi:nucleotide-binding domain-containing protein [Halobacillus trueperi]|uniref:Cyclic GMP-AMP synthase n=1 Tax=Halobacillus trueperi TaxID=156205 RepID=A0A3E0J8C2_9BACI|nr:nucleotidyltransferase [Halobacillus trueperi]REJ09039.1 nucleotidyltransferase [Halobacillus trueperi]